MIQLKRQNAANLKVRDLDESLAWYHAHFGFEPKYDVEGGILIEVNGIELVLSPHENPDAPLADPCREICIHTLAFEVDRDEFEKIKDEFRDDEDMVEIEHERFRSVITEDPNGYCIELYYNI
jgi:catechol-2,3-dioxygenase